MKRILWGIILGFMIVVSPIISFDLENLARFAPTTQEAKRTAMKAIVLAGISFAVYKTLIAASEAPAKKTETEKKCKHPS